MRREWSATIKNRDWQKFEELAKSEPDQLLCDTVAELAKGFTEKADRKALKKVLWILERAGYEPQEEDADGPSTAVVHQSSDEAVAFMSSADASGETPLTYGYQTGGRYRWLTVYLHEIEGIVRASDETMDLSEGAKRIEALRHLEAKPFLSAEIDPQYALWRIKRGVEIGKGHRLPVVIAHWRSVIDRAQSMDHPAESISLPKKAPKEPGDVLFLDPLMAWRAEYGAILPVLEKMSEAVKGSTEEESKKTATKEAKEAATATVFTDDMVREHAMRLKDLAMLFQQNEDPAATEVLAAAKDLEKRKGESHYAKRLVDKTIVMYFQTMKDQDAAKGA